MKLQLTAIANSAVPDHPGFVPDEYLGSLTGEDLRSPGTEPVTFAAELRTVGMWEPVDGGYLVLDTGVVQLCIDHVR